MEISISTLPENIAAYIFRCLLLTRLGGDPAGVCSEALNIFTKDCRIFDLITFGNVVPNPVISTLSCLFNHG